MGKRTPSSHRVVLRTDSDIDIKGLQETLGDLKVDVELLPSETRAYVLRIDQAPADPKALWRRIQERIDASQVVAPVLNDDEGKPHYPTGTLTARFARSLSDDELESFAKKRKLTVDGRNEWVPQQVVFRPRDPRESYLPELAEMLATSEEVTSAWEDTESHYSRKD